MKTFHIAGGVEDITVEGVTGKEAEVAKAVLGVLQKVVNGKVLSYVGI